MKRYNVETIPLRLLLLFATCALFVPHAEAAATAGDSISLFCWSKKKKKAQQQQVQESKPKSKKGLGGLQPYGDVIDGKSPSQQGFLTVHFVDKRDYYFEVPLSLMGRELLVVNNISGVPEKLNETGMSRGINYRTMLIRFEHDAPHARLLIREVNPKVEADSSDAIFPSVGSNYIAPIVTSLSLEAYNPDSTACVVKVNDLFDGSESDLQNVFGITGLGTSPVGSLSTIRSIKAFPTNVLARSELTTRIPGAEENTTLTVEVSSNIVLLPEERMVPRFADERVGIFSVPKLYYSDEQQRAENREVLTRWRLQPRAGEEEKYLRGELVEPEQPIVFYLDTATPPQWRPYIRQGIEDWQLAFEKAGFKNAIIAHNLPAGDSIDVDDARYSSIVYAASEMANAMGPSVVDPRTGEIIESDVMWWHNVMGAVSRWLRIQTGLLDSTVRGNKIAADRMGEALRFVAAHEIGHTLGLMHNMAASSAFSIDSLRSRSFTDQYGTTPSIMDYARFNYVAQPGDSIRNFGPQIGVYDIYAIEYAYRWRPVKSPFEEEQECKEFIARHASDRRCFFGPQGDPRQLIDPRSQSEDLGDDPVRAAGLGIQNLRAIMPQVLAWADAANGKYIEAGKFLHDIIDQWHMYAYHVMAMVGGIYLDDRAYIAERPAFTYVEKAKQQEAVKFLCSEVLKFPAWLFAAPVYDRVFPTKSSPDGPYEYSPMELFKNYQGYILWDLLDEERMARMGANEAQFGKNAFRMHDMLDMLYACLFEKTLRNEPLSPYERIAQKGYVDALIISCDRNAARKEKRSLQAASVRPTETFACSHAAHPNNLSSGEDDRSFVNAMRRIKFNQLNRIGDALSAKRGELKRIRTQLAKSRATTNDRGTREHYDDLILRIDDALATR